MKTDDIQNRLEEIIRECERFEPFEGDDEGDINVIVEQYDNCKMCKLYQVSRESCHDSLKSLISDGML